jgi:hypothetical protein
MKNVVLLLISFLLFFCHPTYSVSTFDDGGWRKGRDYQGFTIYERINAETSILPIKVSGVIEARIDHLMENLRSIEGSEKWTPDLITKNTLKDISPRQAITYSLTDMPWPLYDRRLILDNLLKIDRERKLLFILSKSVPFEKAPSPKKTIEAFVGHANIGFRPIDKKSTYVEMTAFIDPKGSIPAWIINFYQEKWPIQFLKALEERCKKHPAKLRPGLQKMLRELLVIMEWDPESFD